MSSGFLPIDDDLTLHYESVGSGHKVILLLPGWTMNTRVFECQFEYFEASEAFRFISLDPRAHGLSSKTASGHYYEQHGRDLHAFIESINLDNVLLGGWSFGTLATLAYLEQFGSERLSGFIMLDGPPRASGHDNQTDWVTYRYDDADGQQVFYSLERMRNPEQSMQSFCRWMLEDPSDDKIGQLMQISRQTPNEVAALLNASAVFLDFQETLARLEGEVPLWYMMRQGQDSVVRDWAKVHTPSARIVAFGEHMMFWERPDAFNRLLLDFARQCFPA